MSTVSPAELVKNNQDLVAPPPVLSKLNKLLNSSSSSTEELLHIIQQDTALSTKVLNVLNSRFYALPTRVDSIDMAATILGSEQLRNLFTGTAILKEFSHHEGLVHLDLEPFWCHSITAATAARVSSIVLNLKDTEQYFVMGLLHDIGKVIMYLLFPNESKQLEMVLKNDPASAQNAEKTIFGFDHASLGAELLNAWYFPKSIVTGVAQHHSLQPDSQFSTAAAITHLANVVANNLYPPVSGDDDNLLDPSALDILKLDNQKIEGVYEDTFKHMDDLLQVLYYNDLD